MNTTDKCCTFTGHRPDRLTINHDKVKLWLREQIAYAIEAGYTDFITGMQRGVDIWAAEEVLKQKEQNPQIKLIAAVAFKGMDNSWDSFWKKKYKNILSTADEKYYINEQPGRAAFFARNNWMIDHASLLLAVYNDAPGGTKKTIEYAKKKGLSISLLSK